MPPDPDGEVTMDPIVDYDGRIYAMVESMSLCKLIKTRCGNPAE
jgi:hypothetical protein